MAGFFLVKKRIKVVLCPVIMSLALMWGSCESRRDNRYEELVKNWSGKEVQIPSDAVFTIKGSDTVDFDCSAEYKILTYVDTVGCISCFLKLDRWKELLANPEMSSVRFIFFLHGKKREDISYMLSEADFVYPVCIDTQNSLDELNHFPVDFGGQTFLLDKQNRILVIGSPVHNRRVKDLYLRIIRGESPQAPSDAGTPVTTVSVSSTEADLGTFPWQEPRTCTFTLRNTGDRPLVIHDVTTSCGCLTVDYPEEPARPGEELTLRAHYRADSRGTVLKSMQVYCNAQGAPLRLRVTGTAE